LLLECVVFYDGFGAGDIRIRGDRDADKTWEHGDNCPCDGSGHIGFRNLVVQVATRNE